MRPPRSGARGGGQWTKNRALRASHIKSGGKERGETRRGTKKACQER